MPFKIFRKQEKKKEVVEKTEKKDHLLELCEKHFPQDPQAMYYELMRIPVNIPSGYQASFKETVERGKQKEKEGNLKEAAEFFRKGAGLAYKEGSPEDVEKLLKRRKNC